MTSHFHIDYCVSYWLRNQPWSGGETELKIVMDIIRSMFPQCTITHKRRQCAMDHGDHKEPLSMNLSIYRVEHVYGQQNKENTFSLIWTAPQSDFLNDLEPTKQSVINALQAYSSFIC